MNKLLLSLAVAMAGTAAFAANEEPLIIPTPKYMAKGEWRVVVSTKNKQLGQIVLKKTSPILKTAAAEINKYIVKNGGLALPIVKKERTKGLNIILTKGIRNNSFKLKGIKIPENKLSSQAYVIKFSRNNVLLSGKGELGTLYAAITFCHLLKNNDGKTIAYKTRIIDYPDFEYRGDSEVGYPFITRGYLFNQRLLQTGKTYPESVKEYIDICLHLKLNLMMLYKKNLVCKSKDFTNEFIKYAKARGFLVYSMIYASFLTPPNQRRSDLKAFKNYFKRTGQNKKDFMNYNGRIFAWSNEELIRKMVRNKAVKGTSVYYHCTDTGDENWGKRGNKCRAKFGNDRAKADAFVVNTVYDEIKKLNPGNDAIRLFAIIQPYHPLYIDHEYYKYYEEYAEHYSRLHKMVPKEIPFCARECKRSSLKKWNKLMPGRPFYLYHEHRQFHGGTQLIASNIRCAKTFYFPERNGDIFALKTGTDHWELDTPLGAEYSWNTQAPGSGYLDINNKFEFDKDGKLDKDFVSITVPRVVRFIWGEKAAPSILKAYCSRLNINLAMNPFKTFKALNRQSLWKNKKLLPELTAEMFKKQAKAAALTCLMCLKIMKSEVPVKYNFLKNRATRLYKHAVAAKLLALVYAHYFAAQKAVEQNNPGKAKLEIQKAKAMNSKISVEFQKQKKFVKQFPQVSGSFLSSGLRRMKPFKLLSRKINEFKIPNVRDLEKTSVSESLLKKLAKRSIKAKQISSLPEIDGKLNDKCWKKHSYPVTNFFRYPFVGKAKLAYDQTVVKVCYNKKYLYIGIRAYDNDYDSIRGKDLKRDSKAIFSHDIIEVFINPDIKNKNTAQFVLNASGAVYDLFTKKHAINKNKSIHLIKEWNPKWSRATRLDNKGWTAEIAIPFECFIKKPVSGLSRSPKPGDVWRVYFAREKRKLEFSGVKFIKNGKFTSTGQYPKLIFVK
jgi:Carbohydrate family 9 binding domain-like/Glycosyl hydrolase family 20, domain 2